MRALAVVPGRPDSLELVDLPEPDPRDGPVQVQGLEVEADPAWLGDLVSRRVPLAEHREAFSARPDDVKVVLDLQAGGSG